MELEAITTELVERTLRDWQQGKEALTKWLEVDYLLILSVSRVEHLEYLRDVSVRHATERLNYFRQHAGAAHIVQVVV